MELGHVLGTQIVIQWKQLPLSLKSTKVKSKVRHSLFVFEIHCLFLTVIVFVYSHCLFLTFIVCF